MDLLLGLEPLDWNTLWREFYDKILEGADQANNN